MDDINIDDTDYKILRILQRDAKIPNTLLANQVALSPSACLRRVQRMENQGIIEKYVTIVNAKAIKKGVQILVTITLTGQGNEQLKQFENAVCTIPNVMSCFLMGGDYDYLVRIAVKDLDDYAQLHRNTLSHLPHVATLQSNFAMRQVMHRTEYDF